MISLKKHIEAAPAEELAALTDAYHSLLSVAGECCSEVCPQSGDSLRRNLAALEGQPVSEVSLTAETHIRKWGGDTSKFFKDKTAEVKELLMMMAATAESVSERDNRYASQFDGLTKRLHQIADLNDITKLRSSLLQSVTELKTGVEQMAKDSKAAVQQLRTEVSTYRTRLEETEKIAAVDVLTGLANRRKLEAELEFRIIRGREFCVLLLDVNGLKQVNDRFGHLAGDDLLRQFAGELTHALRSGDVVGRLGGDEFLVILDCDQLQAEKCMARIKQWAFGNYTLHVAEHQFKTVVSAAMGLALWKPAMTAEQLLQVADVAMYRQKTDTKVTAR
ncbi:MAG: GGDEF domain-containing protein [Bryobacterales bacterium]|nr:GGDEF domain-containing protein [Bryobacterales bacterium]